MAHKATKPQTLSQRNKDPFSVLPLPKSYYFPSRQKCVNESESIKAPYYPSEYQTPKGDLENNENNSNVYGHPAINQLLLNEHEFKPSGAIPKEESTCHFDEVWPESERPSSPSAFEDTSHMTAATNMTASDDSNIDLQEAVDRLEFYDRHTSKLSKRSRDVGGQQEFEESTLQKYIERFRKSEPKSREERMKERVPKKQDFWWLQPASEQQSHLAAPKDLLKGQPQCEKSSREINDNQQGMKLTKEALMAMDEATLHLQTKAERLLSKSEQSVSSGPIVSTEGLGTSCSISDQSTVVDAPPYRPTFVNIKETYKKNAGPSLLRKTEDHVQEAAAGKHSSGDILARWRFRRKMEESQHAPSDKEKYVSAPHVQAHKQGSAMDARLEEFRKLLLSQRLLFTQEDIHFERQRMDLLMDEDEEQQLSTSVKPPQRDPVLERLQRITKKEDFSTESTPSMNTQHHIVHLQDRTKADLLSDNMANVNTNNSTIKDQSSRIKSLSNFTDPALNRNNTASSNYDGHENDEQNNEDFSVSVDTISSQVICDAKSTVFNLGQPANNGTRTDVAKQISKAKKEDSASQKSSDSPRESQRVKSGRPLRDLPINQMSHNAKAGNRESRNKSGDGEAYSSHGQKSQDKPAGLREPNSQVYHQYLQAEKPSLEETGRQSSKASVPSRHSSPRGLPERENHLLEEDDSSAPEARTMSQSSKGSRQNRSDTDRARPRSQKRAEKNKKPISKQQQRDDAMSSDNEISSEVTQSGASSHDRVSSPIPQTSSTPDTKPRGLKSNANSGGSKENFDTLSQKSACQQIPRQGPDSVDAGRGHSKSGAQHEWKGKTLRDVAVPPSPGQPVRSAIGQTVTEHLFDGSFLVSSVDSWASAFPQSPSPHPAQRSLPQDACTGSPSPASKLSTAGSPSTAMHSMPQESMPIEKLLADMPEEDLDSNEEFGDDPLLNLLRQQRAQYIKKLELIEQHLQEIDSKS